MRILTLATIVSASILSANVNAAVVSTDWLSVGDGLITRDTTSGLDWLDLTQTIGMTYDDVFAGQVAGGQFSGWRYASTSEVTTLLSSNFGIDLYNGNTTVGPMPAGLDQATSFLGETSSSGSSDWTGIMGVTGQADDINNLPRHLRVGAEYWTTTSTFFRRIDPNVNTSYRWDNASWSGAGSWLVSDGPWQPEAAVVPIPAAVWFFGAGLLGLIGVARKNSLLNIKHVS